MGRMEQIIEEIEAYIAECKTQTFSSTNIIVNKEEIEEMLQELKTNAPEEIRRYQKIINNQEAILADAQAKADSIIAEAQVQFNELISEHQIMQQAYAKANEVVMAATNQAQDILDSATTEANNVRSSAITYTDNLLGSIENLLSSTIDTSKNRFDGLMKSLQGTLDIVSANRVELNPPEPESMAQEEVEDSSVDEMVAEIEDEVETTQE